jgi:hypothetical protein
VLKTRALQRAAKLSLAPTTSLLSSATPCLMASLGTETPLQRHVRIYHPGYLAHITKQGCKCYQFTWTSGAAAGKSMIIRSINAGRKPMRNIHVLDFDYSGDVFFSKLKCLHGPIQRFIAPW